MKYNIEGIVLEDPTIELYEIGRDLGSKTTFVSIYIHDDNNGAPIRLEDSTEPSSYTLEDIYVWVKSILKKYEFDV